MLGMPHGRVTQSLRLAVLAPATPKDRLWSVIGGVSFIGYGIYAAHATAGRFVFPAVIFVIPLGAAIYLISLLVSGSSRSSAGARSTTWAPGKRPSDGASRAASVLSATGSRRPSA
jgi:hypothetical protein